MCYVKGIKFVITSAVCTVTQYRFVDVKKIKNVYMPLGTREIIIYIYIYI